jgi:hypothetical protein
MIFFTLFSSLALKYWIFIASPLLGLLVGKIKKFHVVDNLLAIKLFAALLLIVLGCFIVNFSFYYDVLDVITLAILLILLGYSSSRIADITNTLTKRLARYCKILVIASYIAVPVVVLGVFVIQMGNDFIGQTDQIETYPHYRIKHIQTHSNFNFSGYHIAQVYKRALIFEYRCSSFYIGNFGNNDEGVYVINQNDGTFTRVCSYKYDEKNDQLILYKNNDGETIKTKIIKTKN